jgi:hypothetical protein
MNLFLQKVPQYPSFTHLCCGLHYKKALDCKQTNKLGITQCLYPVGIILAVWVLILTLGIHTVVKKRIINVKTMYVNILNDY